MTPSVEQPFDQPWQARAFALTVNLCDQGVLTWQHWTDMLGAAVAADPSGSHYDAWLTALQSLLIDHGTVTRSEIDQAQADWLVAAAHTPHGEPITLDALPTGRPDAR